MEAIIDAVETPYRNKSKSEFLIFIHLEIELSK